MRANDDNQAQDAPERDAEQNLACESMTKVTAKESQKTRQATEKSPGRPKQSGVGTAFRYALQGFAHTIQTQRNMRIHLYTAALVLIVGILARLERLEWALIAICVGLVLASELINTALEAVVDIASPHFHPKAKIAKDAAAAAVFVFAVVSVIVGLLVFATAFERLL
jgi:diacylglycerol kinase